MEERTIHLRIKVKSLADEAKSIREEARKTSGLTKWRRNYHRTEVVRRHARINLLAYGILLGTPYSAMERRCQEKPDFIAVAKIAKRFGATDEMVEDWKAAAKAHLSPHAKVA